MDYLQPTLGFLALLSLGVIFSEDIRSIKIRYVISGVLIQLGLVILLTKIEIVSTFFSFLSDGVMVLKAANDYGTGFVFGYLAEVHQMLLLKSLIQEAPLYLPLVD